MNKKLNIVLGVLVALLGVYCLFTPVRTFLSIGWFLGFIALSWGISMLMEWANTPSDSRKKSTVFLGILAIIVAVIVLCCGGLRLFSDAVIALLFGYWLIFNGIAQIIISLMERAPGVWGLTLVLGVINLLLGVYFCGHQYVSVIAIGYIIAFALIFNGVMTVIKSVKE